MNQKKLIEFCKQRDIAVVAYCPLGQPKPNSENSILNDLKLKELAAKKNKSVAQVILRYLVCIYFILTFLNEYFVKNFSIDLKFFIYFILAALISRNFSSNQ